MSKREAELGRKLFLHPRGTQCCSDIWIWHAGLPRGSMSSGVQGDHWSLPAGSDSTGPPQPPPQGAPCTVDKGELEAEKRVVTPCWPQLTDWFVDMCDGVSLGINRNVRTVQVQCLEIKAELNHNLFLKILSLSVAVMLVAQSRPTLQPLDCSPPGSSVHGIL